MAFDILSVKISKAFPIFLGGISIQICLGSLLIEFKDSESGAVLKRSDGQNHKCVIMPIRT